MAGAASKAEAPPNPPLPSLGVEGGVWATAQPSSSPRCQLERNPHPEGQLTWLALPLMISPLELELGLDLDKPGELCHLVEFKEAICEFWRSLWLWRPPFPNELRHTGSEEIPETETPLENLNGWSPQLEQQVQ